MKKCGTHRAKTGQNPVWHPAHGVMWLDRARRQVIVYNPENEQEQVYDALGDLMALVPMEKNHILGIYRDGAYLFDFQAGARKLFSPLAMSYNFHYIHEAKCGPDGHIWFGTDDAFYKQFQENSHTAFSNYPFHNGQLYQMNTAGDMQVKLDNIKVCTGFEWSRTDDTFFHVDAGKRHIERYTIVDGKLACKELVYAFAIEEGIPSGLAIDRRGNLWTAVYKSSAIAAVNKAKTRVVCIDPQQKIIVDERTLPVTHITSCAIGGEHLDKLYVTTTYEPLELNRVKYEPLAGYLVEFPLYDAGVPNYEFSIENEAFLF